MNINKVLSILFVLAACFFVVGPVNHMVNTFVPVGIVFMIVYKKLDTHIKVIAAGIGFSLAI